MIEFDKIRDTVAENFRLVRSRQWAIEPLIETQIAELASAMAKITVADADMEEKRSIWQETVSALDDPTLHVKLSGAFYDCLEAKKGKPIQSVPNAELTSICYLRNRGSDGAYDCITQNMPRVRALYAAGHEEALENCYDEYCDACILPYSDPERGIHMGFRAMIARYGLKISRMVRVENREGTAMDFVLLQRELPPMEGEGFLAVTLTVAEPKSLYDALAAAMEFGLVNTEVTKLPEQLSASVGYDLHFAACSQDAKRYLFYLALNHPRFDLLGYYQKEREMI